MFLFLDVASPIPEFHLINDKKIIKSFKIIYKSNQKLSDLIIPTYLDINNTHNLSKNIKKLIITIGPGSYTALRVGASFIAGLSHSMRLPVSVISISNIYQHLVVSNENIGIYFESSNDQKYFSYKKNSKIVYEKVENQNFSIPKSVSFVYCNKSLPNFINNKIKSEAFSIKKTVIQNLNKLEFDKNLTIKPIYISNNSILN